MYSRKESYFLGYQDLKLFYQRWIPEKTKGQLVITHGHGEHSENYQRVVDALAGEGWSIYAWDWRGHGRSQGQRGFARQFSDYCYDYEAFLSFLLQKKLIDTKLPTVFLGHSMGGLIQLRSVLSHSEWTFSAQVLSSPMLGVAMDVPLVKQVAAKVLNNFLPRLTLSSGILNSALTRDPEIIKQHEKDTLRHTRICSGVWFGALEAIQYVKENTKKFEHPLLLQMPDTDQVVSSSASQAYFDSLKEPKLLKVYSGYKHEIFNDLDRKVPLDDLKKYLSQFIR